LHPANEGSMPRVVIVGGGLGGLGAAKALSRSSAEVVLVDQKNHHCFQPLLYQVATAALSPADIAWPIRGLLNRQRNASVILARVTRVDPVNRTVFTSDAGELRYDFLVLATGATHFYFGQDDCRGIAPGLKTIEDATSIRRRILLSFERAELAEEPEDRRRLMIFVVIGGGPTGVEMAGAIAELAHHTLRKDFRNIDPSKSRIILIEAGERILPSFPPRLSAQAERSLKGLGVEVRTSTSVIGCAPDRVLLSEGSIEAATFIWAAGVRASDAAAWLDVERDRAGRIKVNADLSVPGYPEIFAIGDTALALDRSGDPVPGVAPAAKQMGRYVGRVIGRRVAGQRVSREFHYRDYGDLATIGRKSAVVKLGSIQLTGFIGWIFWSVAHIYFLIGVRNRFIVAFSWLWSYLTYQRGARLIT
jgi:NADH:ubiquinone reductase (H+-translocating)